MKKTTIVKKVMLSFFLLLLTVMIAQHVYALPTLKFSSVGYNDLVIRDEVVGEDIQLGTPGVVGYNGAYGDFMVNVTTGFTKPERGGETTPILDLNSVNVNSMGSATLDIWFSEVGFGPIGPQGGVMTTVGGTTNGTISFTSYIDNSDALFGTGTTVGNLGSFSGGFSDVASWSGALSSSFSVTSKTSITHNSYNTSSFNMNVTMHSIPEASTMLMLGTCLGGVFCLRKKFSN